MDFCLVSAYASEPCTALAKAALMKLGNAINLQELEIWFLKKSAAKILHVLWDIWKPRTGWLQ